MKRFFTNTLLFVLLAFLWSCSEEGTIEILPQESKDINISFKMEVPPSGGLRSLNGDNTGDEIRIDVVNILAFVNSGNDEKYYFTYSATDVLKEGSGAELKITAKVKQYPSKQIFLIFCNAANEIAAANILPNEELDNVIARIKCGNDGAGEWLAKINGTSAFNPFPMYTRTTAKVVSEADNNLGEFPLVRMLARADITLKDDVYNFNLVDARVYNRTVYGYVAFDLSGWNSVGKVATTAAVPPENDFTGRPDILPPTVIYNADFTPDVKGAIRRSIYLFESKGVTETDRLKGTAIVVGGNYNDSEKITYYRIDIKTEATPTGYVSQDILRNHWYQIEIQSVSGPGYEDPDEAYKGINYISAKIVPWNLAFQKVVATDQYWLNVSRDELVIPYVVEGAMNTMEDIEMVTNYDISSQGFKPGIYVDKNEIDYGNGESDWLSVENVKGGDGFTSRKIRFKVNSPNNSGVLRSAKVKVKAGNLTKVINVKHGCPVEGPGLQVNENSSYVGAFWRADQTGERIIKIKTTNNNDALGDWTAWVYDYNQVFVEGEIVFRTDSSLDKGITWKPGETPADMNVMANDLKYVVAGNSTSASGTIKNPGDEIFFRIGLKSKLDGSSKPYRVRYAVVVLSYNNHEKHQKIFLRQGDDADYLMAPHELDEFGNDFLVERSIAREISPYNLTSPGLSNSYPYYHQMDSPKKGVFCAYPSQAGAFFQWGNPVEGHQRRAYHPTHYGSIPDWNASYSGDSELDSSFETCPEGYRRPIVSKTDETSATRNEIWQTLVVSSVANTTSSAANSVYGYYADGFFDRRQIVSAANGNQPGNSYSVVAYDSKDAAFAGRLFYNPKEDGAKKNASLFIPSSGKRGENGALYFSGAAGYGWTSITASTTGQQYNSAGSYESKVNDYFNPRGSNLKTEALPIRCIKIP